MQCGHIWPGSRPCSHPSGPSYGFTLMGDGLTPWPVPLHARHLRGCIREPTGSNLIPDPRQVEQRRSTRASASHCRQERVTPWLWAGLSSASCPQESLSAIEFVPFSLLVPGVLHCLGISTLNRFAIAPRGDEPVAVGEPSDAPAEGRELRFHRFFERGPHRLCQFHGFIVISAPSWPARRSRRWSPTCLPRPCPGPWSTPRRRRGPCVAARALQGLRRPDAPAIP